MLTSLDQKYTNAFKLLGRRSVDRDGNTVPSEKVKDFVVEGSDDKGEWMTVKLEPGQRILGMYGYLNAYKNIRGLGFITWIP